MRKIIYYVTASLDGFIARPDGAIDWLLDTGPEDFGYSEFFETIDTVVLGRKTYEQALTFGEYPYPTKQSFLFSRTLHHAEHAEIVKMPVEEFVSEQKGRIGKDIWLVGGGEIAKAFFEAKAIDELIVFIQPILLGDGLPVAGHLGKDIRLRLKSGTPFPEGLVRLDYEVAR